MSGIETVEVADTWIYATLSGDAALAALVGDRISGTLAESLPQTPYVTFLLTSSRDVTTFDGTVIAADCIYEVKAVGQGASWYDVTPIAKRVHELIHLGRDTATTASGSLTSVRERVIQYAEVDEGVQYRHLGGLYRIRASSAG